LERITSSLESSQPPLEIVQRNCTDAPTATPVTEEVGEEGDTIVAEPDTTVQSPEPVAGGLLAAKVKVSFSQFS